MELFSTLDNALSQKAEETLNQFAAVKKADVQLQTQLGNRKAQIGINVIGAFAESQSSAFGWQVRAFGAENNSKGANAGIFFRRVDGETLYGINSFVDYEDGDYGEFLRYGIGGELQNRYAAFAMNYYLPITDDKHNGSTVAFSQKGYDANLRINIPQLDFLKVRADYYYYDGDYGVEDDNGFRYGLELQPINDLRIGVFYDDGEQKFGGDIVYVYNFGIPQKRESKVAFSPDLFSPVLREYSQRIMTAQLGPQLRFITTAISVMTARIITPERVFTTAMTMAGMTTILTTETPTMTASRMASVQATVLLDGSTNNAAVVSTFSRFFITLTPVNTIPPFALTISRNVDQAFRVLVLMTIRGNPNFTVGLDTPLNQIYVIMQLRNFTITIVQGSEEFISVGITLTTKNTTTVPHIITETPMTNAAMTITNRITTFATSTITIGAAIDNSRLPPSFPPSSFPPPSPNMPKLAFADSVIPARRAKIQHNRVAIIQKPRRQYAQ